MRVVNHYKALPSNLESFTPPSDGTYDLNFCFHAPVLENELVRLEPLIPAIFIQAYLDAGRAHPELYRFLPYGPFSTIAEVEIFFETTFRRNPAVVCYAIIDKTRWESDPLERNIKSPTSDKDSKACFAGTIGLLNASTQHSSVEIGHVVIFPPFQRTHVTTNAIGLLLFHCLGTAKDGGGLGLRRVQWQANQENLASVRTAQRLGFRLEGFIRWQRVLPEGKEGIRRKEDNQGPGRHSAVLSICWDDWEVDGVKENVRKAMVLQR